MNRTCNSNTNAIVVLSAMSSIDKRKGVTSRYFVINIQIIVDFSHYGAYLTNSCIHSSCALKRLLEASQNVLIDGSLLYMSIINDIESDHIENTKNAIHHIQIRNECLIYIKSQCSDLRSFMSAAEVIRKILICYLVHHLV